MAQQTDKKKRRSGCISVAIVTVGYNGKSFSI